MNLYLKILQSPFINRIASISMASYMILVLVIAGALAIYIIVENDYRKP